MTRVLFKDLKEMTDVNNVEKLTQVSTAQVEESIAIKWVKEKNGGLAYKQPEVKPVKKSPFRRK
jgi:hypothetical protein